MGRWLAAAGAERAASGRRGFLLGMESLGAAGAVRAREERQQVCVCVCVCSCRYIPSRFASKVCRRWLEEFPPPSCVPPYVLRKTCARMLLLQRPWYVLPVRQEDKCGVQKPCTVKQGFREHGSRGHTASPAGGDATLRTSHIAASS